MITSFTGLNYTELSVSLYKDTWESPYTQAKLCDFEFYLSWLSRHWKVARVWVQFCRLGNMNWLLIPLSLKYHSSKMELQHLHLLLQEGLPRPCRLNAGYGQRAWWKSVNPTDSFWESSGDIAHLRQLCTLSPFPVVQETPNDTNDGVKEVRALWNWYISALQLGSSGTTVWKGRIKLSRLPVW